MKMDPALGRRRLRTKAEGFFSHGFWQKRTAGCARAQRRRAHCSDARMAFPKYNDVVASAQAGDGHLFAWDPEVYWRRAPNGERVRDERCGPCRRREDFRSGR